MLRPHGEIHLGLAERADRKLRSRQSHGYRTGNGTPGGNNLSA